MYKYLKLDSIAIFNKSVTSAKLVDKSAPEGPEISQMRKLCQNRKYR